MIEYLVCLVTGGRWQVNGTNLEYICPQGGISEFALIFSEYISYSDFVSLVRSKIGLLDKYRISLRFHHPELNYYIAIVEDMDVRMLINVIKCSGGRAVKVFVVVDEVEEVNGGGEIGNQLVGNLCSYKGSNDPIGTFNTPSVPQFHSVAENVNVSYSPIHYVDPENYKYVGDDDVGTYLNHVGGRCDDVAEQEVKVMNRRVVDKTKKKKNSTQKNEKNHVYGHYVDVGDVCLDITELQSNSDRDELGDEVKAKYPDNLFHGMPPVPAWPVDINEDIPTQMVDMNLQKIQCESIFKNKELLKRCIGKKCLREGFQTRTSRSTKSRYEAVCVSKNCSWLLRAKAIKNSDGLFQVNKFVDVHTCSSTLLQPNHRQANKYVLGEYVADVLAEDYSRVYRGKEIVNDMNAQLNINISYHQAWRAKQYALLSLRGTKEDSFTKLPAYCHNLAKHNPGTVTHIKTDADDRFEFLYVALGCSVSIIMF